ncbi:hypothetical protein [Streptomyces sp. NPDC020489]|uniref:hypothetical protein n=1 Tax=Streptomyces sp. NPDC020489 TaxID=3365077 RepID=UPI0037AD95D5
MLAETARAGLDRTRQMLLAETLDPHTWAARMLLAMAETPSITSTQLLAELKNEELSADETQISRSGRALVERGLAIKTRHGREVSWRTSPRGAAVVRSLQQRMQAQ